MTQMNFITLDALKAKLNVEKIDIAHNPATGKTFGIHAHGTIKVQQDLNPALPIRFMYEGEDLSSWCIINTKPVDIKFSL